MQKTDNIQRILYNLSIWYALPTIRSRSHYLENLPYYVILLKMINTISKSSRQEVKRMTKYN